MEYSHFSELTKTVYELHPSILLQLNQNLLSFYRMSTVLTMKQFRTMMNEYSCSFEKAPSSAHQLVQFSKEKEYGFKYTQIKPLLSIWQREQTQGGKAQQTTKCGKKVKQQRKKINFDSLWDEYQTKYGYSPKTTEKFWRFAILFLLFTYLGNGQKHCTT